MNHHSVSSSLAAYCQQTGSLPSFDHAALPDSTRAFLIRLNLPNIHPYCSSVVINGSNNDDAFALPPDPINADRQQQQQHQQQWDPSSFVSPGSDGGSGARSGLTMVTTWFWNRIPPFAAFAELWVRLLSGFVAPLSLLYLFWCFTAMSGTGNNTTAAAGTMPLDRKNNEKKTLAVFFSFSTATLLDCLCIAAVTSSAILMTDNM
jgi:hypothetical protein